MNNIFQQTISKSIEFKGVGLHSGKISNVKLIPAEDNQGIVFKRTDLKDENIIKADYKNVSSAKLCTTLENHSGVKVSTIEHLLAAFYIAGIDNIVVEIDNEEVPIMDGSSVDFIRILQNAGKTRQPSKRKFLKILSKVELEDKGRKISAEPGDLTFEVKFQLNYSNNIIGQQENSINFSYDNLTDVYSSRTFCLYEDIEKIKKIGLAKGGSLNNAVVVDQDKIINEEGLRNEKEFVNHKILDLAGDFLLSGHRILGKIDCYQGGHQLSNIFLRKLLESKSSLTLIEFEDDQQSKIREIQEPIKLAVNA